MGRYAPRNRSLRRHRAVIAAAVAWLVCALAPTPAPGRAADAADAPSPPDTTRAVPGIVIRAPRLPVDGRDVANRSGFVATLDVGARRHRVEDLAGALSQMVGVRVTQYGGLGGFATASIRGSSANQVDIFMDGVPLNDAYLGAANLGDLPLEGVERIEVYRGHTPPHLGSSAIGGAVDLITVDNTHWRKGSLVSKLQLKGSAGSFGTSQEVVSLWSSLGATDLFVHGAHRRSDGDFEFTDDRGTPQNPADDVTVRRVNNDFAAWHLLGRVTADVARLGNLTASYDASLREQGVPGIGSFQSRTARSQRERHLAHLRWMPGAILSGRLHAQVKGFYSTANETFRDPDGNITLIAQDTDNTFRTAGGSVRGTFDVPLVPLTVEAFYEAKDERFHPEVSLPQPSAGPDRTRRTQHAVLSADLLLQRLALVLTASGRYIGQTTEFYDPPRFPWLPPTPQGEVRRDATTPHVGFRWHPASALTVKGNWGRYVRPPTMLELFGNVGSVTGSADLEPEEGLNRDIGAVLSVERWWRMRRIFIEAVYLDNAVDNLILFFPNSQHTSRPENIGSARIRGWEFSFSSYVGEKLRVAGNYTRLATEDTGPIPYYNGNALPGRPRDDAALLVDYALARWTVAYELHYIGANYLDPANLKRVPSRTIHNAAVRVLPFEEAVSLTMEIKNLTDERVSDVSGFPLPGRSAYLTVNVQR